MLRAMVIAASFGLIAACAATEQDTLPGDLPEQQDLEAPAEQLSTETADPTEKPEKLAEYTKISFGLSGRDEEPSAADKKRCTDVGGRVQRAGLRGVYQCVQTYPDAGKVCRDSDECLGDCRTSDSDAVGKPGTGMCQEVDVPFGCFALVRDGVVDGGMLCVD